jgi:hypothetical protein
VLFQFLKALCVSGPDLPHPSCGPLRKLRMVFLFPGAPGCSQGIALLPDFDLAPGDFSEDCTAAPFAHQLVDIGHNVNRENDMRSFDQTLGHTASVT